MGMTTAPDNDLELGIDKNQVRFIDPASWRVLPAPGPPLFDSFNSSPNLQK
jgi:hypothetical protein